MIRETILDKILYRVKKLIPRRVFEYFQPMYHEALAYGGALRYGFPSRRMKVIGVTGTKGKSTTVFLITKILEGSGHSVAAIGSLGFKIKDREWPNTLKMTMPGRFRLQKFLAEAKRAGCEYVALEVTSEGIKQKRHLGITFDCAVFTNLHKEHLESHGSIENYIKAKQELFQVGDHFQVLNVDDPHFEDFDKFAAEKKITYGLEKGDIKPEQATINEDHSVFQVGSEVIRLNLGGAFNVSNALAAWSVGTLYEVEPAVIKNSLEKIESIPGRFEFIQKEPFNVVVDYAHTPDSLEAVYSTLKKKRPDLTNEVGPRPKLICVLGAAGGGRDKWKRPEFGALAEKYCDEIFLTDEDPYDENPTAILDQVQSGILSQSLPIHRILDRKEAIGQAIGAAQVGDTVVITGKGSEISMAVANGKKIPWSDKEIVKEFLKR